MPNILFARYHSITLIAIIG